jgi:DNA repair protein RadD
VLVTVDVVSEGFDCPGAAVAILLRPTQSEGLYLQQVGRVLRPASGKPHAIVLDHVGNVHRHGFPDDHRDWTLDDARQRTGKSGPPAPCIRTCEACFAAFAPQPICPVCGTPSKLSTRELKHQAGELQELAREAVARSRRRDQGQARTLQELIHLGQARGMKNPVAWAKHVHFARQGKHG